MAEEPRDPLAGLLDGRPWGRCLELACGRGAFLHRLAELAPATAWLALDLDGRQLRDFHPAEGEEPGRLGGAPLLKVRGWAECAPLVAGGLDSVACSFSLHHFARPGRVLGEACRLLKPGGRLVLAEPLADGLRPTQRIHRDLHHLSARLDRRVGRVHGPTYRRRELEQMLAGLPLRWTRLCWRPPDIPAGAEESLAPIFQTLDRLEAEFRRCRMPDLRLALAGIRQRVQSLGYGFQTQFLAVGVK